MRCRNVNVRQGLSIFGAAGASTAFTDLFYRQADVGCLKPATELQNPMAMSQQEETAVETRRRTASEIFEAATESARSELKRSSSSLGISGFAAGITLGLTGLGVASIRGMLGSGPWQQFVASLLYPVGFITVIIGRQQLFTENTLYPVVLSLDEPGHWLNSLRLWVIVFCANIAGAIVFAGLASHTTALGPRITSQLIEMGGEAATGTFAHIFWSGVVGGWVIALVAWVVSASHWTIGQVAVIWLLTFIIGAGHFAHCVASSCEILTAMLAGSVPAFTYLHWLAAATVGNIAGGVVIVSVLNYAQVRQE